MCWDPLLEGGGHPTPRGAWRPPSVERAGLVQGSVGDGNPGSGSRVCAGSAGAGRGVAGENVVGLLPWKQRTSLSLPVNRLLPEAGGIEGPVLSLSLPVPTTGENSCFQGIKPFSEVHDLSDAVSSSIFPLEPEHRTFAQHQGHGA